MNCALSAGCLDMLMIKIMTARRKRTAQQRIKAGCPPNSEMELESELEDALGEAARSDQLPV
jgi:hypothetical protein